MSPDAADRAANLAGAMALLLADRIRAAVEPVTHTSGASAAALTALAAGTGPTSVDGLAGSLRLSHSRAVRVVDGLEREGWAVRRPDPSDGRRALVGLTARGRRVAARVLAARAEALRDVLAGLDRAQLRALADVAATILGDAATGPSEARALCRLCDVEACGFARGDCPAVP